MVVDKQLAQGELTLTLTPTAKQTQKQYAYSLRMAKRTPFCFRPSEVEPNCFSPSATWKSRTFFRLRQKKVKHKKTEVRQAAR